MAHTEQKQWLAYRTTSCCLEMVPISLGTDQEASCVAEEIRLQPHPLCPQPLPGHLAECKWQYTGPSPNPAQGGGGEELGSPSPTSGRGSPLGAGPGGCLAGSSTEFHEGWPIIPHPLQRRKLRLRKRQLGTLRATGRTPFRSTGIGTCHSPPSCAGPGGDTHTPCSPAPWSSPPAWRSALCSG